MFVNHLGTFFEGESQEHPSEIVSIFCFFKTNGKEGVHLMELGSRSEIAFLSHQRVTWSGHNGKLGLGLKEVLNHLFIFFECIGTYRENHRATRL